MSDVLEDGTILCCYMTVTVRYIIVCTTNYLVARTARVQLSAMSAQSYLSTFT